MLRFAKQNDWLVNMSLPSIFLKRGEINHIQIMFLALFVTVLKEQSCTFPNDNKKLCLQFLKWDLYLYLSWAQDSVI